MEPVVLGAPRVSAYRIPTDFPESDGTLAWDSTILVLVEVDAGGKHGLGYSYADTATAVLVRDKLTAVVEGRDALDISATWQALVGTIRNLGRSGIASMAISAIDVALWDLKAKLLELSIAQLLGQVRDAAPVYGSGGFTSYPNHRLCEQLAGWAGEGIGMVKMKVGREPARDPERVAAARSAIGDEVQLFVDANGAYARKQALRLARIFAEAGVTWYEEPVSFDDLAGLHLLRDRAPPGMDIAAGEYGYDAWYFRRMLAAEAVDVLQADASRCGGITGFMQAAALAQAFQLPLSAHCAPSLHAHPACAAPTLRHIEYFHDHARIEHMLFDGAPDPVDGVLRPEPANPGLGLAFKHADAKQYEIAL
jgi:L-alanine-DL-glutamate epimerase-like enolase superfamily enzyme